MKDVRDVEIKAGDIVHLWWPKFAGAEENYDFLCTVVRTRGRGIKFVADDGQTFTTEYLTRIQANIAIQGGSNEEKRESVQTKGVVTIEELDMIGKLRKMGWYGGLYKKTANLSTVRIDMPELEDKR